ncbi:MAG: MOSC domain-containing protein [Halobacteriaceae archaeon]
MAHLARLRIFPIKSLDGHDIEETPLVGPGSLQGDRAYAITDDDGEAVTGKRTSAVHGLSAEYNLDQDAVTLRRVGDPTTERTFSLDGQRGSLNVWLSEYFGEPVSLIRDSAGGFPDDTEAHGPTLVSRATLRRVASWFDLGVDDVRRRFRANVEIGGVEPFWEDRLYGEGTTRLEVGETILTIDGPSRRCIVPARDPDSGRETPQFKARFVGHRRASRPSWVTPRQLGGHFRLAVNTVVPEQAAHSLRVGAEVTVR